MPSGPEYWLANTWILHLSTVATRISFQPEAFVEAKKWQDHDSLAAWKTAAHAMATASLQRAIKMLVGLVRSVIWSLVFVPRRFCWNSSQCHNQQDMKAGDKRKQRDCLSSCVIKPGGRISSNNSQLLRNDYRLVYRYSFVTPVFFFIIHHHHLTSSSSHLQVCEFFCPEYDWQQKKKKTLELGFTYRCLALLKQSYRQNGHINRFFFSTLDALYIFILLNK